MYTVDKYRSTFLRTTSSTYRLQTAGALKKQLRLNQRGFANIQKVPLHLIFFCFITVMRVLRLCSCEKKGKITVDKEARHLNTVMYVCNWSLSSEDVVDDLLRHHILIARALSSMKFKKKKIPSKVYLEQSSPRKLFFNVYMEGGGRGASSCSRSFGFHFDTIFFFSVCNPKERHSGVAF